MRLALVALAIAGCTAAVLPGPRISAQDMPKMLNESSLKILMHVSLGSTKTDSNVSSAPWENDSTKVTLPGNPVAFKFVGTNIVVIMQLTPFLKKDSNEVMVVTQEQVWVQGKTGMSYHTSMNSMGADLCEKLYYYPLGKSSDGTASLTIEVVVERMSSAGSEKDSATTPSQAVAPAKDQNADASQVPP